MSLRSQRHRSPARPALALFGIAALLAVLASTAAGSPRAARTASAKAIAVVSSASGGHLTVVRKAGGAHQTLAKGGVIRYGDLVLAGHGAHAVLIVTVPKGDPGTKDLLDVRPAGGATVTLKVERTASRTIEVTLSA